MKLYTSPRAPNPRRVHIFIAEKHIEVPTEQVDLGNAEQFSPQYLAINPDAVVPTLVLDDGTAIGESLAICRVLEALHPTPALFGRDPTEIGLVDMWTRRIEIQGYFATQDAYRNSRPGFAGRALPGTRGDVEQIPALVDRSNATIERLLGKLDAQLAGRTCVIGDWFSVADIVLVTTLDFGRRTKMAAVQDLSGWPNVEHWYVETSQRPSVQAAGAP